jgi:hypothetical protein
MKRPLVSASVAALLCCAASLAVAAPLNRCTDPQTGAVSFTDRPCPSAPGAKRADPVAQQRSAAESAAQERKAVAADLERQLQEKLLERDEREEKERRAAALRPPARPAPLQTESVTMNWSVCTDALTRSVLQVGLSGYRTTVVVNAPDLKVVRLCLADASVLVTCSRPEAKMITVTNRDRSVCM